MRVFKEVAPQIVFLSASVPLPGRNPKFFETADVVAIREAIKGLVLVLVERHGKLIFGGHPAITPLIELLFREANRSLQEHVKLFQSGYFFRDFPKENTAFGHYEIVDAVDNDREASLLEMRRRMIAEKGITCGIFVGGMEGVLEEFQLLREMRPDIPAFPIASTGAAAAMLPLGDDDIGTALKNELTYPTLFRNLLR